MSTDYTYDVALSFAGEDRDYVGQVARDLESAGVRVFYDRFETAALWGENLVDRLDRIYREESRYVVIFISRYYIEKAWPRHERQSAQARALVQDRPYILPVRFDDAQLPGLAPTIGYLDLNGIAPSDLAMLIKQKLESGVPATSTAPSAGLMWDPDNPPDPNTIVNERPLGWEHMLLATVIARGLIRLRPKRRRFEMGMATPTGARLQPRDAINVLAGELDTLVRLVESTATLMGTYLQRALGDPGVPGDADMIVSAGDALVESYAGLLDWAERVRSYNVPSELNDVADLEARYASGAIREFEAFASRLFAVARDFPELAKQPRDEPLTVMITWSPTIDGDVQKRHKKALRVAKRRLRI